VLALLQHGADVRLINAEGNSAYNVAMMSDIKCLIEGNSRHAGLVHMPQCFVSFLY